MSTPTNHWKLGLFVIVALVLLVATLVYLGEETLEKETVRYTSYFDEAVTGLEVGSPVKYRGVSVGNVAAIDVAPDRRHVEVRYELEVPVLGRLGLAADRGQSTKITRPADLRAQLGSTGVTGVKYVQLDFFDVEEHPLQQLPFPVPENHLPTTSSTLKNIEESVTSAVDKFPEVADEMVAVLTSVHRVVAQLERQDLGAKVTATLENADRTLALLQHELHEVRAGELSSGAQAALANMNTTLLEMQGVIERVDGDQGLLASAQRASDSLGDVAGDARGVSVELDDTLREVRHAAEAIRELVDVLERDSDMLVKGRAGRQD